MRRTLALVSVVAVAVLALFLRGGCAETRGPGECERAGPDTATAPAPSRRSPVERAARPVALPEGPAIAEERSPSQGPVPEDGPPATAPSAEPPPADTGPFPEGEIPEADRGKGECSLAIDLRDAATGRPHAGWARLWRLGVPADAKWPAGDHVQVTLDLERRPAGVLRDLPEGRYRLEVLSAAPGTEDPPEFRVEGAHTNLRVDVTAPPMLPVRLRIFDETGEPILAAKSTYRSSGASTSTPVRGPAWSSPRNPVSEDGPGGGRGGWRNLRTSDPTIPRTADRDGAFLLGEVQGPARDHSWTASWVVRPEARTDVSLTARSDQASRGGFVAVSVPIERIEAVADEVVLLADGSAARAAGATVRATCYAVLDDDSDDDALRRLPIRVHVLLAGHTDASFDWVPDGPRPEPVVLRPTPVK